RDGPARRKPRPRGCSTVAIAPPRRRRVESQVPPVFDRAGSPGTRPDIFRSHEASPPIRQEPRTLNHQVSLSLQIFAPALQRHAGGLPGHGLRPSPRRYAPAHVTLCDLSEFLDTMNACYITMAICSVRCKRFDGFWHNSHILEVIALGIRSGDIPVS